MIFTFEKSGKSFYVDVDRKFESVTLADLENLKDHLDYFIKNEHINMLSVIVGGEDD